MKKPVKKIVPKDVYFEYETIPPHVAATAVVLSIDDDTIYPEDFIKRMLVALNTGMIFVVVC